MPKPTEMFYFIYRLDGNLRLGGYYKEEEAKALCERMNKEAETRKESHRYEVRYEAR